MGLDISKITNAELQKLAYLKDTDNNGTLDGAEFAIFKAEAAAKEGVSTEDFNQAMGLYTTNPASSTEATEGAQAAQQKSLTAGMTAKQAETYQKEADEAHIKYLKAFVNDGGTRNEVLAMLDTKANLDPKFRKAVVDVMALMPASYTSSDDIKHKDLVKKLEDEGIKDDLHENILKQLEKMAKNECIAAKTSEIADAYAAKLAEAQSSGQTKTSQQIMDEIKNEAKSADKFKGDFKEAFNKFNQPMIDAYNKVYAAIAQVDDLENGGKVQDKAEDILKANGQWDKYTKKALLGDRNVFKRFKSFLTGYKSDGRIASDNQGRWNRVEHKKTQTTQEIMDSLGNKTELFVALRESGFIKQMENGTWDLSELSAVIGKQLGADAKLNRDAKKDTDTSEIRWTKAKLAAISGLNDQLTESQAKALVRLCGYEIEGKNWRKAIFGGILGAVSGAALTSASAYAAGQLPKDITVPYYKDKAYDISGDLQQAIDTGKLPEGVTVDASGQIHIITDILVKIPSLAGQLGELSLYAAVPGALVGTALGLASGLKDKGQMPKIPVNFDEMTYEEFAKTVNESETEYAPIALLIAASFVDDKGNWDREGYKQFLNSMAGDKNGIINREELIGGLQKRLKEVEKKDDKVDGDDNGGDDEHGSTCDVNVKETPGKETINVENKTYVHLRKEHPGVGWKEMVEAYFPGLIKACGGRIYGPNGAIRAFQRELCTDENGNFDAAKLKALITANDVPKEIKIPLQVKGIDRVIQNPTSVKVVPPKNPADYKPAMDKVGRDEVVTTKQVGPSIYLATDGCNNHTASGSTPKEAVENLEKQEKKQYSNRGNYVK